MTKYRLICTTIIMFLLLCAGCKDPSQSDVVPQEESSVSPHPKYTNTPEPIEFPSSEPVVTPVIPDLGLSIEVPERFTRADRGSAYNQEGEVVLYVWYQTYLLDFKQDYDHMLGMKDERAGEWEELGAAELFGAAPWVDRINKVLKTDVTRTERDIEAEREAGGDEHIYRIYYDRVYGIILNEAKTHIVEPSGVTNTYYDCYVLRFNTDPDEPEGHLLSAEEIDVSVRSLMIE